VDELTRTFVRHARHRAAHSNTVSIAEDRRRERIRAHKQLLDDAARTWVAQSFAEQLDDDRSRVERVERGWQDARDSKEEAEFRLPFGGPPNGLTEEFLQDVAKAYAAAVARRERPNVALARQTGSPVKSVQRWVYTARQRGIMPRGSRGRPG
jgi:hypothetical protein